MLRGQRVLEGPGLSLLLHRPGVPGGLFLRRAARALAAEGRSKEGNRAPPRIPATRKPSLKPASRSAWKPCCHGSEFPEHAHTLCQDSGPGVLFSLVSMSNGNC